MIAMNPNDTSLERDRLRVVIATIVINIVVVSLLTFAPWSDWRTGAAQNCFSNTLRCFNNTSQFACNLQHTAAHGTVARTMKHTACMLVSASRRFAVTCCD